MIFVDTGAFVARYVERDQYHKRATRGWKTLGRKRERLVTSNFVLDETFTLVARRAGYAFAVARARAIMSSEVLTILRPGAAEELDAVDMFEKYADQSVSFTDCISFVLMRGHGLGRVFGFDRHFQAAGFRLWP